MTAHQTDDACATAYARIKYRLLIIELLWTLAFLWLAIGPSVALTRQAGWQGLHPWWQVGLYGAVFALAHTLVHLPWTYYGGYHLERHFGLATWGRGAWMARELKKGAIGLALFLALLEGFYAILRAAPQTWWWWATLGWVSVSVVLTRVTPTLIVPLFYRCRPLADRALAERLVALVRRAGLTALDAFEIDFSRETRKANAALVGLGRTRRILVADTMLAGYASEEIEAVLAHELGHHRHHHIAQLLAVSAAASLAGFYALQCWLPPRLQALGLSGLADVAGFSLVALGLTLVGIVLMPLQHAQARRLERQADRFALELTRQPAAFMTMMRKLAAQNLADPHPPRWVEWWFYDHPSIPRRIAFAESWRPA